MGGGGHKQMGGSPSKGPEAERVWGPPRREGESQYKRKHKGASNAELPWMS